MRTGSPVPLAFLTLLLTVTVALILLPAAEAQNGTEDPNNGTGDPGNDTGDGDLPPSLDGPRPLRSTTTALVWIGVTVVVAIAAFLYGRGDQGP